MNEPVRCERCGEALAPINRVWLELSFETGRYKAAGEVPAAESQGCFPFGKACAAAVMSAGGINQRIRERSRPLR